MYRDDQMDFLKAQLAEEKKKNSLLEEELSFYRNTFIDTASFIAITTITGEITFINQAFIKFLPDSYSDTLTGHAISTLPVWDQPEQIGEAIKKTMKEGACTGKFDIKDNAAFTLQALVFLSEEKASGLHQIVFLMRMAENQLQDNGPLQINEQSLKNILNIVPVGVSWFATEEQMPDFANNLLLDTLGYSEQEALSLDGLQVFPANFFKRILTQTDSSLSRKKHFMDGVEFRHKNGKSIFFNIISDFVHINGRKRLLSFYRDVTEEKKIHDLLIRKEESLKQAQRIAKVGNWEWTLADDSRYYSDELFHIHDFTPSENFSYEAFLNVIHPDDKEKVATVIQEALDKYQPYEIDFRLLMPSGQIKYLHGASHLFLDKSGKPEKMVGAIQDISEQVKAQEALQKSENRLKRAQQIGKTGYWEWDLVTDEVYWSDELYVLYDMPKGIFVPTIHSVIEMMHESERKRITDYIYSSIENKQTYYEIEGRVVTGSGQLKYFIAKAEIIYDAASNPVRMEGISQDITSIRKTEETLRYNEYLLQNVNDAILSTDEFMHITSWNKAAERIYGWTWQEAIGKNLQDMLSFVPPAIDSQVHRDFMEKGYWKGEHILKRKDGSPITIQAHTILLKDENQRVTGMVSVDRDVTEFNTLQEKVTESEKMLQLVINSVPQSIFWKDTHSVYLGCNENFARMASLSGPWEVSGKTDLDMPWAQEKAEIFMQFDRDILGGKIPGLNRICTHTSKDGTMIWLNVNIVPLQDTAGNNIGILGTLDDITEKKRIEESLKQKQANLEAIIENTDNLIWSVSREYKVLAMNSKLAHFYKHFYKADLQTGDHYLNTLPEWLHKRWIANHKKVLTGEKIVLTKKFKFDNRFIWFDIFSFPIVEADGQISGVAYMSRDVTERIKNEQLILKYIKQHNTLKLKQEKLKMLAILQGQEEERRNISMELHDGVGQLQTALLYKMNKLTDKLHSFNNVHINTLAGEITSLQKDIYHEIRRISEHLMPQYLNDFTLDQALTQLMMLSFKNMDIRVESNIKLTSVDLSKSLEVAVFRIIQEIINNVLKHAQANQFYIKLYDSKQYLHIQIKDNGIGFSLSSLHPRKGKGLSHIKERINLLNGNISIVTQPNEGCYIEIRIPIF